MFMEAIEKAGINGLITGAASAAIFGTQASVIAPMTNMTMPLYALLFLGGVASSVATDGLHLVMKDIPISKKANDRASVVAGMAVNGIVLAGLLQVTSPEIANDFGKVMALGLGAAAEFGGASSYTYLKEKMYI
jgi:hypothetical protein